MESNTNETQNEVSLPNKAVLFDVDSLGAYLAQLKDGRKLRRIRYHLVIILILIILAKLCGQDKYHYLNHYSIVELNYPYGYDPK